MPKIIDHDKYRNELLSKCFDIFAEKGYGTMTMRELAAKLKVSTGTLYHYWNSKEEIFEAFVLYLGERDRAVFFKVAGQPPNIEERLRTLLKFVKANEDYFLKQFFIGMDYYRHKGKELITNPVMRQSNKLYRDGLAQFLGTDDQEILTFILSFISGTVIGRMYEGEQVSFESQGELLVDLVNKLLNRET